MFAKERCEGFGCVLEAALPMVAPIMTLVIMVSILLAR